MPPSAELAAILATFRPAEMALRDWVVPFLDDSMVEELAAADYGMDVADHRRAIRELMTADRLPEWVDWYPGEVLALMRWSYPSDPEWKPGSTGRRGHLLRLFSSLVLVAAATPQSDPVDSLAPLVESALELGADAVQAAYGYLAWCRLTEPGDWRTESAIRPFLTFALLLLRAASTPHDPPATLTGLAGALVDELTDVLADEDALWDVHAVPPVLGLRPHGLRRRMWRALVSRCLIDGPAGGTDVGVRLALLGQAVRGEVPASLDELRWLFAESG
jgi:hypothetical protein